MINLINTDNNRSKTTNSSRWATRFLKEMHLDVFLFIDYRRDYLVAHRAMPNIPVSTTPILQMHTSHLSPLAVAHSHARSAAA